MTFITKRRLEPASLFVGPGCFADCGSCGRTGTVCWLPTFPASSAHRWNRDGEHILFGSCSACWWQITVEIKTSSRATQSQDCADDD